jgi:preprotein translocase subunit SecA
MKSARRGLLLAVIDDLWADYLANVAEFKGGIHWVSWGGRDPLHEFLTGVQDIYADLRLRLEEEAHRAFENARVRNGKIVFPSSVNLERGATWTYLTTDQPFGSLEQRIMRSVRRAVEGALRRS